MCPLAICGLAQNWHPLVLEPDLHTSVDDYICDSCEEDPNLSVWAYRCSDSCGDRTTFHVSCIVTSHEKRHFRYNIECQSAAEDSVDHDLADELEERLNVNKSVGTF